MQVLWQNLQDDNQQAENLICWKNKKQSLFFGFNRFYDQSLPHKTGKLYFAKTVILDKRNKRILHQALKMSSIEEDEQKKEIKKRWF